MMCKVIVQRNTFAESLAIVGRAAGMHGQLPILSNLLLSKEEDQLRLSATDLTLGISVWMDARMDGDLELTLPARTLTDVVNTLTEPEIEFSVDGKPEACLENGTYTGMIKGVEASEFPAISTFDVSEGVSIEASIFKEMVQNVSFAASMNDSRPVLTGVLLNLDGKTASMVATDGFRLAIYKAELPTTLSKTLLNIPACALKEVVRILGTTRAKNITLFSPKEGNQVVLRCENVQIVSQLIDGKYPDYQAILPKGYKTRTVIATADLLNACKQASVIAREGNNAVRAHLQPGADQTGKIELLAQSDETGASTIELAASVEGQELECAFNVKYMIDGLEAISTGNVVIETNAHNTPAVIHSTDKKGLLYLLMLMQIDGK
jgi:DNA polymerase-3 subunit beta